ncbi:MAG TPA: SGNH hydrolase domain-containing protein [Rhodanobacter sp.]|nr:SGNH hydrolase domain-containing protein [Rhodanobacter sp.]
MRLIVGARLSRQYLYAFAAVGPHNGIPDDPFLCDARKCRAELDGAFLYRDEGHLSYVGSIMLARAMHLVR